MPKIPFHRLAVGAAMAMAGCSNGPRMASIRNAHCTPASNLQLALVDSVVLRETDSVYIGVPGASIVVAPSGDLLVPDYGFGRLVRFARSGELRGTIGHVGGGPGEFRTIGAFGLATDRSLLHIDAGARRVNVFDAQSGLFRTALPYDGYMSWITHDRGEYLFGLIDYANGMSVAVVPDSLVDGLAPIEGTRLTSGAVALPAEYRTYPMLRQWNDAKVTRARDTLVVAFGGLDYLVRVIGSDREVDTFYVPVCGRRGTSSAVLEQWFRNSPRTPREAAHLAAVTDNALSGAGGLWRLGDGKYLVWYQDPTIDAEGKSLLGVAFVSVLSADLQSACVDAAIKAPGLQRPRIGFYADSLFVLDQTTADVGGASPSTVVRVYVLKSENCQWLSTSQPDR